MILGVEVAMFVLGIISLGTGKLYLFKGCVVWGTPARLLGLIACAPAPLMFMAGFVYGLTHPRAALTNAVHHWTFVAIEAGLVIVCTAVVYAAGWLFVERSTAAIDDEPESLAPDISVSTPEGSKWRDALLFAGVGIIVMVVGLLVSGYWSEMTNKLSGYLYAQSRETPDSDVDEIPPAPPSAGPVPAYLGPADWQARIDWKVQFNRRTLRECYDKVGNKNPKWDEHAQAAMELTALHFSNLTDPQAQPRDIRAATQKSLDAGCDDPLILYLHARAADASATDAELDEGFARAAKAMNASAYPPFRRASAIQKHIQRKLKRLGEPGSKAEAARLIGIMLRLLPVSAREDKLCIDLESIWHDLTRDAYDSYKKLGYGPQQSWHCIDELLATEKKLKATRLLLHGDCSIQWAWEARGYGYADTVSQEKFQKFDEHLSVACAALEKSWQLAPEYGKTATLMLTVELGRPRGRAEMEKWFERAMQYNPSLKVCAKKLEWLHPKWHGSTRDMLAFGRACRDGGNWDRQLPMIIVEVHQRIADMQPSEAAKSNYFRQPEVAADILYVYAKYLERHADDAAMRSRYAYYCWMCGHPRRAHRQFELVGDKLWWGNKFTETVMKETRAKAAKQAARY